MTLLLIIIGSITLSALGLMGVHLFRERSYSWFTLSLLVLLFVLPLGTFLPGITWQTPVTKNTVTSDFSWISMISVIWVLGFLISLIKIIGHLYAYRTWSLTAQPIEDQEAHDILYEICKKARIETPPALATSSCINSPVIGGLRKPTLFLPKNYKSWDQSTLKMVFWHEIGHVARKDLWKHLFGQVARALYWFNPLIKTLQNTLSSQCELATDAWVIQRGVSRKAYLEALCNVAENAPSDTSPQFALAMADHASLADRVKTLVDTPIRKNPYAVTLFLVILTLLGLSIVSLKTSTQAINESEIELRLSANPFPMD